MRIDNSPLTFDTTDLSQATATSTAINLSHVSQYAVQIVTSGTHAGTLKIQVSCDEGHPNSAASGSQVSGVVNWSDLPNATAAVSNSGVYLINVADAGYCWARVVYTKTSGTGAISSSKFNVKGI